MFYLLNKTHRTLCPAVTLLTVGLFLLQDVNYPGSTYVLSYDRTRDILEGIYFHPSTKQSYEVGFVRQVAQ